MSSSLPRMIPDKHILLTPEPLLPSTFSQFGTAILPPLPSHLRSVPSKPPSSLHQPHQPNPQPANQNTALKTSPISPLINKYPAPSSENESAQSKGLQSIFSCFPRQNTYIDPRTGKLRLRLEILERHPYTTQTFCPFNFSSASTSPSSKSLSAERPTYFLVVVAPTLNDPNATPPNPPDLTRVRAFLAPVTIDGGLGMAVTYAAGTWHAPMVVLGDRRVDFLVSQFANGVANDDCQEVLVGGTSEQKKKKKEKGTGMVGGGEKVIEVDLKGLGLGLGSETEVSLWKAKL